MGRDPAILGLLIRLVFGTVFLAAGASKLSDLGDFAEAVKHYRLLPGASAGAVARLVATVEAALGTLLLVGAGMALVGVAGSVLLVLFALAIAINLIRGRQIPCGCKRDSEPIQVKHIVRNAAGVAALLYLTTLPAHQWSIDRLVQ
ncbi:MAG: MauE/DoxX family redox-associated membrane protein [Actinomycetota bacterium]